MTAATDRISIREHARWVWSAAAVWLRERYLRERARRALDRMRPAAPWLTVAIVLVVGTVFLLVHQSG